jgi:hypothetical protein
VNFLERRTLTPDMLLSGEGSLGGEKIGIGGKSTETIQLPDFHVCIMNPPFTRSVGGNLLFGSLPKKERQKLQLRLGQLLKQLDLSGIGQAGLGAVFVSLADKYLLPGGRIGLVLPRAVLSGVAWQKIRSLLLDNYQVEYIITSYEAPKEWNFSENTNLSEVLLVAKKLKKGETNPYTFFVNLQKKPTNEIESIYLGSQLIGLYESAKLYDIENSNASPYGLKLHGKKSGEVYSAELAENFGFYNFFYQTELNRTALLLKKGIVHLPDQGIVGRVSLTTLEKIGAEIGPDRRQIHDSFSPTDTVESYRAMWGHESELVRTISQKPNSYLAPKDNERARNLWKKRGRLLIVERLRLNTYRTLAVHCTEEVLSNVWWPVTIDNEKAKILTVWLNSTFGIVSSLPTTEVTEGPWIGFKKEALYQIPVPNIAKLKDKAKNVLLKLYDEVSHKTLKTIPEEFSDPTGTRRIIDDGIKNALGLDGNMDALYKALSREPMITAEAPEML